MDTKITLFTRWRGGSRSSGFRLGGVCVWKPPSFENFRLRRLRRRESPPFVCFFAIIGWGKTGLCPPGTWLGGSPPPLPLAPVLWGQIQPPTKTDFFNRWVTRDRYFNRLCFKYFFQTFHFLTFLRFRSESETNRKRITPWSQKFQKIAPHLRDETKGF